MSEPKIGYGTRFSIWFVGRIISAFVIAVVGSLGFLRRCEQKGSGSTDESVRGFCMGMGQESLLAKGAYKFIAILISSFVVAVLITIATIYVTGRQFSQLGTGEMWLLLVLYYLVAAVVTFLFVFYLKFAVKRGVQTQ